MHHVSNFWSIFFYLHYKVDELVDELRNGTPLDVFDYIVFFMGLKNMEINISLSNIDHLTNFEAPMFNKWLDFMLMHTFTQNVASNTSMYLLLNAQASRFQKNETQNGRGTKRRGTKYFKHSSTFNNTIVVYLDKNHWSLYILEEKQTIHYDFILGFHNNTPRSLHIMCVLHGLYLGP
jgi:hypothetical protein